MSADGTRDGQSLPTELLSLGSFAVGCGLKGVRKQSGQNHAFPERIPALWPRCSKEKVLSEHHSSVNCMCKISSLLWSFLFHEYTPTVNKRRHHKLWQIFPCLANITLLTGLWSLWKSKSADPPADVSVFLKWIALPLFSASALQIQLKKNPFPTCPQRSQNTFV